MGLRRWQEEALEYFKTHDRCIIEAATGTGKTRLAIEILKLFYSPDEKRRTLIIAPKNVILEKTWFNTLVKHFPITQVGLFYGEAKEPALITITNMQSIDKLDVSKFSFIICDELHNYMSDRMLDYLIGPFDRMLGLTATLKRKDSKHWELLKIFDFNIYKYDITEAVHEDVLSQFRFHNIGLNLEHEDKIVYEELDKEISRLRFALKSYGGEELKLSQYAAQEKRKKILSNSSQKIDSLVKLKDKLDGKKVIIFNEYNAIATPIFWTLTELGFCPCIFNSSIPKKKRMENLEGYATGRYDVIITTRALDEGYDLPEIDTAVLLSGGSTSRQMIQRVGRVLRKTENDKDIYQVYFKDTLEEETAMRRYELMKDSCKEYDEMVI